MQFIVYTKKGDAMTMAIVGQIRSLLSAKGLTAQVQLVDDPNLLAMNGIESTPTVVLDGLPICQGYIPSRTELERSVDRQIRALASREHDKEESSSLFGQHRRR
ncbi:thioredoxin family protein [bacterium]|nr:thioredoxin family protein [bacterium]